MAVQPLIEVELLTAKLPHGLGVAMRARGDLDAKRRWSVVHAHPIFAAAHASLGLRIIVAPDCWR
jgi:hypothetical protein